jgi:four helix bundle protein
MPLEPEPHFEEWERTAGVEQAQRRDPLWRMRAYRLAVYLSDVSWDDAVALGRHPLTRHVAEQLLTAVGSVRANLSEGYSRSAGRDRVKIFEYALGSAREARDWYSHGRRALPTDVVPTRTSVLDEITRLLLAAIPRERARTIRKAD